MKRRQHLLWLIFAVILAFSLAGLCNADHGFSLMTWNVRGYPEATAARQTWFSDVLEEYDPDILCVQEIANIDRVTTFINSEPAYTQFAFLDSSDGQDNAIFFHGDVLVSDVSDPTGFRHPAQLCYFRYAGLDAYVLTVHLTWDSKSERAEERRLLRVVAENAMGLDQDLIIAGDFNTTGGYGDTIKSLADELGMIVVEPVNYAIGTTCAGSHYDYILMSQSVAASWYVSTTIIDFDNKVTACAVSDHRPLLATFEPTTP